MPTRYEIYLCRDTGERLVLLSQYFELQYQIVQQEAGFCHLVVPGTFDASYIRPDYKIAIWRQPDGGSMALEDVYLIRFYRRFTTAQGQRRYEIVGANGNSLLVDRVTSNYINQTYYFAGLTVTGAIDNTMKSIVRTGLQRMSNGSLESILSTYFSIEANTSKGASLTRTIGVSSLADECTACGALSRSAGIDLLWHVVPLSETEYQFRTYVNQIGQDRTWPDGYNPILVSEESGTMSEGNYTWDGIEAKNAISAVGVTQRVTFNSGAVYHTYRYTVTVLDKLTGGYNNTSEYSHREAYVDAGFNPPGDYYDYQNNFAREELDSRYPKETFTFKLKESQTQRYGRDWKFGDKITAYYGNYYTCRIRGVTIDKKSADAPEEVAVDMDIIPVASPEMV